MRGVIYTAIAGGFDELAAPAQAIPDLDYLCFTDDLAQAPRGWQLRAFDWTHSDPVRVAKRVKILPHRYLSEYDWSLWIDGNVHVRGDLKPFLEAHLSEPAMQAFRHPRRSCIYREAQHCIDRNKDDHALIREQLARYRAEEMPADFGLSENNVILRRHGDPKVREIMELWWDEIFRGSRRDQLSLSYVLWKQALQPRFFFDGERLLEDLPYFEKVEHPG